ncbi:uncharacterized protein LOC106012457 [Aplysia californica]|uniref:Uncharacterized protein LOC106012457 n=1 Tax=Aplysia californica TaxID=6500 RepID=A0ABM1A4Z5_APLCA|nr:uncharacterized protein LOC106012457 [Aplysia californica]
MPHSRQKHNKPKRGHSKKNKGQHNRHSEKVHEDDIHDVVTYIESVDVKAHQKTSYDYAKALVPYTFLDDPSLRARYEALAARISCIIKDEAQFYGRAVCTDLLNVPGLWTASLGGSHFSLLAEVAGIHSWRHKIIKVQDIRGHQAMVRFHPELSKFMLPGTFILIKGAHWQQTNKHSLEITVQSPEDALFFSPQNKFVHRRRPPLQLTWNR